MGTHGTVYDFKSTVIIICNLLLCGHNERCYPDIGTIDNLLIPSLGASSLTSLSQNPVICSPLTCLFLRNHICKLYINVSSCQILISGYAPFFFSRLKIFSTAYVECKFNSYNLLSFWTCLLTPINGQ